MGAGHIPVKFRTRSGVDDHKFLVKIPWRRPYNWIEENGGKVQSIPPTYLCETHVGGVWRNLLIREQNDQALFEAVSLLCSTWVGMPRAEKYMRVFKAYECLVSSPEIDLSAVRHAISHPSAELNRPATVAALKRLFGGTRIDFSLYRHVAAFWTQYGQLVIRTDVELNQNLAEKFGNGEFETAEYTLVSDSEALFQMNR